MGRRGKQLEPRACSSCGAMVERPVLGAERLRGEINQTRPPDQVERRDPERSFVDEEIHDAPLGEMFDAIITYPEIRILRALR